MKSKESILNMIICGVGGQGNILLSRMIGRIMTGKGYFVTIGETFGAAQRGGAVFSSLRISKENYYGPLIPEGQVDVILSLEPIETLRTLSSFGSKNAITLTNVRPVPPIGVISGRFDYPQIEKLLSAIRSLSKSSWFLNATELAMGLGSPIVANIIMLGAIVGSDSIPLDIEEVEEEIKARFPDSLLEVNLRALKQGFNETKSGN